MDNMFLSNFKCAVDTGDAIMESNDDPEVIRAKYFIRDEFLVGVQPNYFNQWEIYLKL